MEPLTGWCPCLGIRCILRCVRLRIFYRRFTDNEQVTNLEAHNANLATGLEHLEKYMRENGHPEAKRLCSTLNIPSGNGGVLEVDGFVVADNCATILEVKNSLNEAAETQLQRRLDIIW